jgi:hypothetical protein
MDGNRTEIEVVIHSGVSVKLRPNPFLSAYGTVPCLTGAMNRPDPTDGVLGELKIDTIFI